MGHRGISRRRFVGSVALGVPASLLGRPSAAMSAGARFAEPAVAGAPAIGPVAGDKVRVGFIGVGNRGDQVLDAFLPQPDCADRRAVRRLPAVPRVLGRRRSAGPRRSSRITASSSTEGHRRRRDRDPGPLARDPAHRRVPGREGRLRREAPLADDRRGTAHGRGRPARRTGWSRSASSGDPPPTARGPPSSSAGNGRPGLAWRRASTSSTRALPGSGRRPPGRRRGSTGTGGSGPPPSSRTCATRCHYKFRWFWDYSGGQLTNFGTHYLDLIQWVLGQRAPRTVTAVGGKYGSTTTARSPTRSRWRGPTTVAPWSRSRSTTRTRRRRTRRTRTSSSGGPWGPCTSATPGSRWSRERPPPSGSGAEPPRPGRAGGGRDADRGPYGGGRDGERAARQELPRLRQEPEGPGVRH